MSMYHPHDRVQLQPGKGRTKQSFAEESNINLIMKKYEKTGMLDHLNKYDGKYGNFIAAPDYHTAMNQIRSAGEMFMEIPASIRSKFDNDPAQFLKFAQDPENFEAMKKMGLAKEMPDEEVVSEPPTPAAPPEAPTPPGDAPKPPADPPLPL